MSVVAMTLIGWAYVVDVSAEASRVTGAVPDFPLDNLEAYRGSPELIPLAEAASDAFCDSLDLQRAFEKSWTWEAGGHPSCIQEG